MTIGLTYNNFNPHGFWRTPIIEHTPSAKDVDLFDQNGYDLTELEKKYALVNHTPIYSHRLHRTAIKREWFFQEETIVGAHLNHSQLFERKGYDGYALKQLTEWAKDLPILNKLIAMRPKWGLDFSMDYVDRDGNAFELLHWEWDSFNYGEIVRVKSEVETKLLAIDWDDAAVKLLERKHEWYRLNFFDQSDWKCNYFGVAKEQFKMVIWK